jgi:hypothetical protein
VAHGGTAAAKLVLLAIALECLEVARGQRKKPTDDAIG